MNLSVHIPGSKSFTNRHIVLAGMCSEKSFLTGALFADDTKFGMNCLKSAKFNLFPNEQEQTISIHPPTFNQEFSEPKSLEKQVHNFSCDLGQAGTLARFFPAVALNFFHNFHANVEFTLTGSEQLQARPLKELLVVLKNLGAHIEGDKLPIQITPWKKINSHCEMSGAISGQFLSGLLLAAAGSKQPVKIKRTNNLVQPDYVSMTLQSIEQWSHSKNPPLGHDKNLNEFEIFLPHGFSGGTKKIEADASTACYFACAALFWKKNLTIENLGTNSLQPDVKFLETLKTFGAPIVLNPENILIMAHDTNWKLPANLTLNFSKFSDQALTMACFMHESEGTLTLTGIGHIRHHESDRLSCLHENLKKIGIQSVVNADGITIFQKEKEFSDHLSTHSSNNVWQTYHDHRFAMTGYLHKIFEPNLEIENPSCVSKTCPSFFELMGKLF
jgi:3-phosphoshikimate 1-carboxyvinyltransferase